MQDNTISSEELACVGIHCTHGMRQKGETAMKVTSTKKDLMLYGAMTILFAVGSILYIDLHGFTKIYYLLCLIALFLLGVLFFRRSTAVPHYLGTGWLYGAARSCSGKAVCT